jgi:hypothetical protein
LARRTLSNIPNFAMNEQRPASKDRLPALAMTALSVAYPLATVRYFWEDWFRFLKLKVPVLVEASGWLVPTGDGRWSLLSPWRMMVAGASTLLLWRAARALRHGAPGARAMSLMVLLGLVLPQTLWYGELSLDWFRGEGFFTMMLASLAASAVPALLMTTGRGVREGWGALQRGGRRVLLAGVGLGWLGFASTYFLEHLHNFQHTTSLALLSMATMGTAALGMLGLYRQKVWGILAAVSAVGAWAGLLGSLIGQHYAIRWSFMGLFVELISGSATRATVAFALPLITLVALLGPFLVGFVRKALGHEPLASETPSFAEALASSRAPVWVQTPAGQRVATMHPEASDEDALLDAQQTQDEPRRAHLR